MLRSGLIGRAILASRSPWLHEQEARAQGLDLTYELVDFDNRGYPDDALADVIADLVSRGFSGFNVTYPFKQAILPLLDRLDESASLVGAVNTVAIGQDGLTGHNTDMSGFRESFESGLPGADLTNVLQIGAGGAGSAVAVALLTLGTANLTIADLDRDRARDLTDRLASIRPDARMDAIAVDDVAVASFSGILNASPVGMAQSPGAPIPTADLRPAQWIADIVYFPLETALLRDARARGCATLDGSGMAINQAALAFEIINGRDADVNRMRASFAAAVG
ncbi:MAG: shikimate dehydrogenase [Qipengyuania sp.]|jgi:shikimate dehydrogenase|nr:shikimate dehydrogenase [Qipengyuania sp.]